MQKAIIVEREDNIALIERLHAHGMEVIPVPAPRLRGNADMPNDVSDNEVIAFVDSISADAFLSALTSERIDEFANLTVCAIGSPVIEILRRYSVHADVVSFQPNWVGLWSELEMYLDDIPRSLSVVGGGTKFRSEAVLASGVLGITLEFWPSGFSAWESGDPDPRLRALVVGGGIDLIVLCGPGDIVAIEQVLAGPAELKGAVAFASEDEMTLRALAELGVTASRLMR